MFGTPDEKLALVFDLLLKKWGKDFPSGIFVVGFKVELGGLVDDGVEPYQTSHVLGFDLCKVISDLFLRFVL